MLKTGFHLGEGQVKFGRTAKMVRVHRYVFKPFLVLIQSRLTCFKYPTLLDATRIADGRYVFLKVIKKSVHPYEADIGLFFSSETLASDPRNHCVPIYEVLQLPDDDDKIILVMPLLREYYNPRFDTVGEVVEFFRQVFEVLENSIPLSNPSDRVNRACNLFTKVMSRIGTSI